MARVFLVEDNLYQFEIIREFLENGGHQILVESREFEDALGKIKEVKKLGVNLAILDGSLRPQSPNDGAEIAAVLRKEAPEVKIIGLSAMGVTFGDRNLQKPVSSKELLTTIAELGLE